MDGEHMKYTDEQLEDLLDETESDLAERKEFWKGDVPDTGRQAVCAFANDLPDHRKPGVLFVGAKDDGMPSRLVVTDELLRTLSDIKTDGNILPPPSILVEKRTLKGAERVQIERTKTRMPQFESAGSTTELRLSILADLMAP
jgi:ATP-dependent DNA helicase RecG